MSLGRFIDAHRQTLRHCWLAGLFLYLGLIALASLLPPRELPLDPGGYDKLWHAAAYALAGLACVPVLRSLAALLLAWLGLAGFGLGMEFLQGAGGVRSFDWYDALANSLGAGLGVCAGASRLRGVLSDSRRR